MKYKGFKWSVKVWLSSSLITPVIMIPIMLLIGRSIATSFSAWVGGILYIILPLLIISSVPWLIVQLFLRQISNSRLSEFAYKVIIFLVVVILPGTVFLTGALYSKPTDWIGMLGYLGFVIATALCVWFYKLKVITA